VVAGEPGAVAPRLDLFDRIAFRYRRHGASQATEVVLPSHEPVSLSSRDDYALSLRPSADGWLYVYQIDASRRVRQLFPNAGFGTKSNPVNAYQDYLLPSSGAWYYLDETVGPETIYVVFSTTERADLDAASTGPEAAERLTAEINRMFALSDHRRVGYMTFRFQHQ
jgi:hypothetical protein